MFLLKVVAGKVWVWFGWVFLIVCLSFWFLGFVVVVVLVFCFWFFSYLGFFKKIVNCNVLSSLLTKIEFYNYLL